MTNPRRFAEGTEVASEKTRMEIEKLLMQHGASQRAVFSDDASGKSVLQFMLANRMIRLEVNCPTAATFAKPAKEPRGWWGWSNQQKDSWRAQQAEQGAREAWRRLLLLLKAKLEMIADGATHVEREFLADIVLPDGSRVLDAIAPRIAESYQTGRMPQLMPKSNP